MRVRAAGTVVDFRQAVDRRPVIGQTDEYLVAQVRAGNDAAFEAIYDRYARGMLAFCVHMLGSREAAEDALQLSFVSASRALLGGESNVSLRYSRRETSCGAGDQFAGDDFAKVVPST